MKRSWMLLVATVCLLSALALTLGACGGGSGSDIVGTWSDGSGMKFTFASDGSLAIDLAGQKMNATYSIEDGKLALGGAAATFFPEAIDYKIDGDKLTLTSPEGEKQELTRVK
jgi:hypothetical protein